MDFVINVIYTLLKTLLSDSFYAHASNTYMYVKGDTGKTCSCT